MLVYRTCEQKRVSYQFAGRCGEAKDVLEREPADAAGLDERQVFIVGRQIAVFVDRSQRRHRVDRQHDRRHDNKQHRYDRQHLPTATVLSHSLTQTTTTCVSVFCAARRYASAVYAVVVCPSVRPPVCLSQAGTVTKRLNIGSRKLRHMIA